MLVLLRKVILVRLKVIPMHSELKIGTLKAILKQAQIGEEEISEFL